MKEIPQIQIRNLTGIYKKVLVRFIHKFVFEAYEGFSEINKNFGKDETEKFLIKAIDEGLFKIGYDDKRCWLEIYNKKTDSYEPANCVEMLWEPK